MSEQIPSPNTVQGWRDKYPFLFADTADEKGIFRKVSPKHATRILCFTRHSEIRRYSRSHDKRLYELEFNSKDSEHADHKYLYVILEGEIGIYSKPIGSGNYTLRTKETVGSLIGEMEFVLDVDYPRWKIEPVSVEMRVESEYCTVIRINVNQLHNIPSVAFLRNMAGQLAEKLIVRNMQLEQKHFMYEIEDYLNRKILEAEFTEELLENAWIELKNADITGRTAKEKIGVCRETLDSFFRSEKFAEKFQRKKDSRNRPIIFVSNEHVFTVLKISRK